jgi:hypothetical protein
MSTFSEFRESASLHGVRVSMKKFGDVLDTRRSAAKVRAGIEREVLSTSDGDVLVLDFKGVRAITVPFADECIGLLLAGRLTGYHGSHPVLAVNANEDVRDTLSLTLATRRLGLLHVAEPLELLGGDDLLNDTLSEAWAMGQFTASELAERLRVSPQAANNRLKALVSRGALRRALIVPSGGGKEFVYTVPEPDDARRRTTTRSPALNTPRRRVPASSG